MVDTPTAAQYWKKKKRTQTYVVFNNNNSTFQPTNYIVQIIIIDLAIHYRRLTYGNRLLRPSGRTEILLNRPASLFNNLPGVNAANASLRDTMGVLWWYSNFTENSEKYFVIFGILKYWARRHTAVGTYGNLVAIHSDRQRSPQTIAKVAHGRLKQRLEP